MQTFKLLMGALKSKKPSWTRLTTTPLIANYHVPPTSDLRLQHPSLTSTNIKATIQADNQPNIPYPYSTAKSVGGWAVVLEGCVSKIRIPRAKLVNIAIATLVEAIHYWCK